jgi:hypothetical protein
MNKSYLETYYNQDWVYREIKGYFKITELVAPKVVNRYGVDQSWSFLDFRMLSNLLWIRRTIDKEIYINRTGQVQRGLRSIKSKIVLNYIRKGLFYLSAHIRGSAVDFDVYGMEAWEVRDWIVKNSKKLPFKCRLENKKNGKQITWVHMDSDYFESYPIVYLFNV